MNSSEWILQHSDNFSSETIDGLLALAEQMEDSDTTVHSPIREVFALLGDRWSKLILLVLNTGTFGHAALKRTLQALAQKADDKISQRILTLKLRSLERDGFIVRRTTDDVPPRVDYSLTPMGKELTQHVQALITWLKTQAPLIEASRSNFEEGS